MKNELVMNQEQVLQQYLDAHAKEMRVRELVQNNIVDMIMGFITENREEIYQELDATFLRQLRNDGNNEHAFLMDIAEHMILKNGDKIYKLMLNCPGMFQICSEMEQILSGSAGSVARDVMNHKKPSESLAHDHVRRILENCHQRLEQKLDETMELRRAGGMSIVDFEWRHLGDLEALYNRRLMTFDQAIMAANGNEERLQESMDAGLFVGTFGSTDKGVLEHLLDTTPDPSFVSDANLLFAKETISGKVLQNPVTGEKEAFVIHERPPIDMEKPEAADYKEKQLKFLEHGVSGGKMNYESAEDKAMLKEQLLSGKVGKLLMMIGKNRMQMYPTMLAAMRALNAQPNPPPEMLTYYLNGMTAVVDVTEGGGASKTMPRLDVINKASQLSTAKLGYKPRYLEKTGGSSPTRIFEGSTAEHEYIKIGIIPGWQHVRAKRTGVLKTVSKMLERANVTS